MVRALLQNAAQVFLISNNLGGNLSTGLGALFDIPSLAWIDLSDNEFSGGLPLAAAPGLMFLSLRNNRVGGSIPADFLGPSNLLEHLDLKNNNIGGVSPFSAAAPSF